jgi:hypothetical protein
MPVETVKRDPTIAESFFGEMLWKKVDGGALTYYLPEVIQRGIVILPQSGSLIQQVQRELGATS